MKMMKFMVFALALTFCVEVSAEETETVNTQAPVAAQEVAPVEQPKAEAVQAEQPAAEQPKVESVEAGQPGADVQTEEKSVSDAQAEDEELTRLMEQFTQEQESTQSEAQAPVNTEAAQS